MSFIYLLIVNKLKATGGDSVALISCIKIALRTAAIDINVKLGDGWRLTAVRGRTTLPNGYWWHPVIASVTAFTRDSLNLWPVVQHGTASWQLTVHHSNRQLSHLHLKCEAEKSQMWNLNFTTYCPQPKHNICVYNIIWNKIRYKTTKWDIIFEKQALLYYGSKGIIFAKLTIWGF